MALNSPTPGDVDNLDIHVALDPNLSEAQRGAYVAMMQQQVQKLIGLHGKNHTLVSGAQTLTDAFQRPNAYRAQPRTSTTDDDVINRYEDQWDKE